MKTEAELVSEAQALATVPEDQFESSLASFVSDLQAFFTGSAPAADPIVSITTTTQSGVTAEFVPQTA